VGTPTQTVARYGRGTTFLPGDNRRRVPHQSPSRNERGHKTERSTVGSVTVLHIRQGPQRSVQAVWNQWLRRYSKTTFIHITADTGGFSHQINPITMYV